MNQAPMHGPACSGGLVYGNNYLKSVRKKIIKHYIGMDTEAEFHSYSVHYGDGKE